MLAEVLKKEALIKSELIIEEAESLSLLSETGYFDCKPGQPVMTQDDIAQVKQYLEKEHKANLKRSAQTTLNRWFNELRFNHPHKPLPGKRLEALQ